MTDLAVLAWMAVWAVGVSVSQEFAEEWEELLVLAAGLERDRRGGDSSSREAIAVDRAALVGEDRDSGTGTARRHAVEQWMQKNNVIRGTRAEEVSPYCQRFVTH